MPTTTIPARRGAYVHLKPGQKLKMINTHGNQVIDFWAFSFPAASTLTSTTPTSITSFSRRLPIRFRDTILLRFPDKIGAVQVDPQYTQARQAILEQVNRDVHFPRGYDYRSACHIVWVLRSVSLLSARGRRPRARVLFGEYASCACGSCKNWGLPGTCECVRLLSSEQLPTCSLEDLSGLLISSLSQYPPSGPLIL
jgi:hypothetical protein